METQNDGGSKGSRETTGGGNKGTTGSTRSTAGGSTTAGAAGAASGSTTTGNTTRGTTTGATGRSTQKRTTGSDENGGLSALGVTKNQILTAAGAIAGGALLFKGVKALTGSGKKVASGKTTAVTANNSVIIKKPKAELFAYWRNLENLPNFMSHLEEVNQIDDRLSEWSAEVPGGLGTIEWEAEIIREEKNRLIVWRSLPGSEIENSGEVRFEDAPGGKTQVESTITYRPPAGDIGGLAGKLVKPAFKSVVENDLKQFKKLMEKGGKAKRKSRPTNKM